MYLSQAGWSGATLSALAYDECRLWQGKSKDKTSVVCIRRMAEVRSDESWWCLRRSMKSFQRPHETVRTTFLPLPLRRLDDARFTRSCSACCEVIVIYFESYLFDNRKHRTSILFSAFGRSRCWYGLVVMSMSELNEVSQVRCLNVLSWTVDGGDHTLAHPMSSNL